MRRKSLVLLVGLTLFLGASVTPSAASDPAGPVVDSDDDGLIDVLEIALGTDPADPDSDGDGIIDGGDPDILIALIDGFDDGVFKDGEPGLRMATGVRLSAIEAAFVAGQIEEGLIGLDNLRKRFDGCPPKPDRNDWIVDCEAQLLVQELIDILIAGHFSYRIDPTVTPETAEIPGLSGGPARSVVAAVGPDGTPETFVADEVILQSDDPAELAALLSAYGGTVLRDGTPLLVEGETPNPGMAPTTGFVLVDVDPATSPLGDFAVNMEAAGLRGAWTFSSDAAARLTALVARERADHQITLNQIADFNCSVCEHPADGGGYLDAATWWWMGENEVSVGVIRAWEYLRYQGFPPTTAYYPTWVAVVDSGFDLDTTTGVPLVGGGDFLYSGSKPPQLDEIDYDWTAGGIALGFSNCPEGCWHGQMSFGTCCANGRNLYGTAGTSGGGTTGAQIKTLLIRVGPDVWEIASGVYDAAYNNADVVNTSIDFNCNWMCREFQNGNVLKAAVGSARNTGAIVVASAGNAGDDIGDNDIYPCELDGAICVGAIVRSGLAWDGSNYGTPVDMWAPTGLRSTLTRVSAGEDIDTIGEDELAFFNGTSCSAPYLSGIVALMKALNPYLYKSQILTMLQDSANTSTDPKVTTGYVDALRAVQQVKPNQPPTIDITSHTGGDLVPYDGVYFGADVNDPEKAKPWGDQFDVSVTFTSNRQGALCADNGVIGPYGCAAPTLLLGSHTITATATDAFGATASDQVQVFVVNTAPTASITYPATGSTFYTSQTVNFSGFGFDPDEVIQSGDLTWHSSLDGDLGTGWTVSSQLSAGTHTITLTVTDGYGSTGTDTIDVEVMTGSGYPSAQITAPANGTIVAVGDSVTLTGIGTDPEDGTLSGASLVWQSDLDGTLETGQSITVTLSGSSCTSTVHVITLTVTDADGHTATHSIWINVLEIC